MPVKLPRFLFFTALTLCLATSLHASVIFSDDFSHGLRHWEILTGGPIDTSSAGGVCTVRYRDGSLGIVRDTSDLGTDTFTYSATVTVDSGAFVNNGIGFCIDDNFNGYYFVLSKTKEFRLFKIVPGGDSTIFVANLPNSNINATVNQLSVSKHGHLIRLFCNGAFLDSLTDTSASGGSVALVGVGVSKVRYDDVVVVDTVRLPPAEECFADNFATTQIGDWFTGFAEADSATVSVPVVGTMRMSTTDSGGVAFTSGTYQNFSMQAVLNWQGGDSTARYGIAFYDVVQDTDYSYTSHPYALTITAKGGCSVYQWDAVGDSITEAQILGVEDSINGSRGADTLTLLNTGSEYVFLINGHRMFTDALLDPATFSIDGAGIFASDNVIVDCHSFDASPTPAFQCPVAQPYAMRRAIAGSRGANQPALMLYDPLGRRVAAWTQRASARIVPGVVFGVAETGAQATRIVRVR